MQWFAWIEQTSIGSWVREAPTIWAFPFVLLLHTVGLAMVAGTSVALNAFAWASPERWRSAQLEPWFQFAWAGFAVNLVSGVLLLAAYAAKALTNPVFYLKLLCVVAAMYQLQWLRRHDGIAPLMPDAAPRTAASAAVLRRSAVLAFAFWGGAVVAGRLLAYTYRYLMASDIALGL